MPAKIIDPAVLAALYRDQLRVDVAQLSEPLTLLGLLAEGDAPSATYAAYTQKGCDEVGIRFVRKSVSAETCARAVREAGDDPAVHGILVYYPIAGAEPDGWLRELVDPRKDIEGLHSFWARCLYENRRYVDGARTKQAILPSTPLAVLKLIEAASPAHAPAGPIVASLARPRARFDARAPEDALRRLSGVNVCIFNRSAVVGQPLAAMLANDGAEVVSFDVDGPKLFLPASGDADAHCTRHTDISRAEALARAHVVVTGVPSRDFPLVRAHELREGAVCVNFSTLKNFADDVLDKASAYVPRVGPMTVTMALRNTVRLYRHTH